MSESSQKKDKRSVTPIDSSSEDEPPVSSRTRPKNSPLKPIRQIKKRTKILDIPDTPPVLTPKKITKKFDTNLDTNLIKFFNRPATFEYNHIPPENVTKPTPTTPTKPSASTTTTTNMSSSSPTAPLDNMNIDSTSTPPASSKNKGKKKESPNDPENLRIARPKQFTACIDAALVN